MGSGPCPGGSGASHTRSSEGSQVLVGPGPRVQRSEERAVDAFCAVKQGGARSLPSDLGSLPRSWMGLSCPFNRFWNLSGESAEEEEKLRCWSEIGHGLRTRAIRRGPARLGPGGLGFSLPSLPPQPAQFFPLSAKLSFPPSRGSPVAQRRYSEGERCNQNNNKKRRMIKNLRFCFLFRLIFPRWHFLKCHILEKYENFLFMAPWPMRWRLLAVSISLVRSGGK